MSSRVMSHCDWKTVERSGSATLDGFLDDPRFVISPLVRCRVGIGHLVQEGIGILDDDSILVPVAIRISEPHTDLDALPHQSILRESAPSWQAVLCPSIEILDQIPLLSSPNQKLPKPKSHLSN